MSHQGSILVGETDENKANKQILNIIQSSPVKLLSCVQLFVIPWTVAYQAFPSMGFSRQEYWSGLPFPSSGDFPDPGIKARSPTLQEDSLQSEPPEKPMHHGVQV